MKTTSNATGLRLTATPYLEYAGAVVMIVIAGILAFSDGDFRAGTPMWLRGACIAIMIAGAILFLRAESIDHFFDRRRRVIELSWHSLIRTRRRVLRWGDVARLLVEEDTSAENGRPTRIALVLTDGTQVRLTESYMPFRTPVVRASRALAILLGVPSGENT